MLNLNVKTNLLLKNRGRFLKKIGLKEQVYNYNTYAICKIHTAQSKAVQISEKKLIYKTFLYIYFV
jgi:hypothetical protein